MAERIRFNRATLALWGLALVVGAIARAESQSDAVLCEHPRSAVEQKKLVTQLESSLVAKAFKSRGATLQASVEACQGRRPLAALQGTLRAYAFLLTVNKVGTQFIFKLDDQIFSEPEKRIHNFEKDMDLFEADPRAVFVSNLYPLQIEKNMNLKSLSLRGGVVPKAIDLFFDRSTNKITGYRINNVFTRDLKFSNFVGIEAALKVFRESAQLKQFGVCDELSAQADLNPATQAWTLKIFGECDACSVTEGSYEIGVPKGSSPSENSNPDAQKIKIKEKSLERNFYYNPGRGCQGSNKK